MTALVRFGLGFFLVFSALFLIALVLIQRGRGGGLAGAFGGAGGQSAFGTKAGDVFTRITVGVAGFWILLCILTINVLGKPQSLLAPGLGGAAPPPGPAQPAAVPPAATTPDGSAPAGPEITPVAPETKPATPETKPADEKPAAASEAKPAAEPGAAK